MHKFTPHRWVDDNGAPIVIQDANSGLPDNTPSKLPDLPWRVPEGQRERELKNRKTRYTSDNPETAEKEREQAWAKTTKLVQKYSDEMIKRWNAEIDTYLVFAGLFSAVLTAFNVQSYILLQPATPDPTLLALQQISLQLSSFSTGTPPAFINSTHEPFQPGNTPSRPIPRWAIWLNTLWFTSLILSLSSASIGIMVKQWLNEYVSGISVEREAGTSRQTARLRQYRLNNLIEWHVGDIVNIIPVLLQVSVALFLAGLLVLLWTLHPTVATISSVFAGLLGAFTTATVFLPSIKPGCAYLSPQSLALHHIFHRTPSLIRLSLWKFSKPLAFYLLKHPRMMRTPLRQLANAVWRWRPVKAPTWRGTEQSIVSEEGQSLDAEIISKAYSTAMNPSLLSTAAICLSELDPSIHVIDCIERLQRIDENHFGDSPSPSLCAVVSATGPVIYDLWADSLLCQSILKPEVPSEGTASRHPLNQQDYLSLLDDRLSSHFSSTTRPLSNLQPEAARRMLLGLSLVVCHVDEVWTDLFKLHRVLYSVRLVLAQHNLSGISISLMAVSHAAMAAHQRMLRGPSPDIQELPRFCAYLAASNIILECVLALKDDSVRQREIRGYAVEVLSHIVDALRLVNEGSEDSLAKSDRYWLYFFVRHLSDLMDIVMEDPILHSWEGIFPGGLSHFLERTIVIVLGAIRRTRTGQPEDDFPIRDRAGRWVTLQSKLDRLRANIPGSALSPQRATQSRPHGVSTVPRRR